MAMAFSVSLAVKDIEASKSFYTKLGFEVMGDYADQGWAILRMGETTIGLYQGMFEKNLLTFNPGWDSNAQKLESFEDVREIQKRLKDQGIAFTEEADETSSGPAHFVIVDPDGNPIMFDQHV